MLRLSLILNNFAASLPNVVQGNTLTEPFHKESNGFCVGLTSSSAILLLNSTSQNTETL